MKKTFAFFVALALSVSCGGILAGCKCDAGSSGGDCQCALDTDCIEGFHCERCRCMQDCTGPGDCPPERPNCDVATGRCVDPCTTNADCPDPAYPNCGSDGICFGPCEDSADCINPDFPNCGVDGICNGPCTDNTGCTHPDYPNCFPQTGLCAGPCTDNSDCPPEFPVCDPQTGECGAGECQTDNDCHPPVTVCENWVCVPGCTQHSDCAAVDRCDLITPGHLYHCEPRDCFTDADCNPPVTVCDTDGLADPDGGGYCEPGCQTYYDCRQLGYDCDPPSGRCSAHDYGDIGQDCGGGCDSNFCLSGMGNVCTAFCCVQHDCPPGWGCRPYDDGTGSNHTVDVCVTLDATHGMGRHNDACTSGTQCRSGYCGWNPQVCRESCCTHADCSQPFLADQECRLVSGRRTACVTQDATGNDPVGALGCSTTSTPSMCISNMCFTYYSPDTACTDNSQCAANRPTCWDYPIGGPPNGTNDCVKDMCVDHCCSSDDCPDYGGDIFFCGKWTFGSGDYNICLLHEGAATGAEGDACGNNTECSSRFCSTNDSVCRRRCCTDLDCTNSSFPRCALELHSVHGNQRWLNVCLP